ncbi:MAG: hypothetical protein NT170_01240 [Candidatus Moranbacteria bacterium]|nr:hypothetical protein [Candidatus Moranbacteria bacterium]
MTEEKLEKIYRMIRVAILFIPVIVIVIGAYLVFFPIDSYNFYPNDPKLSKFEIEKSPDANQLTFGVFPLRNFRYIDLLMSFKKSEKASCASAAPEVSLAKTYQAFLNPTADAITSEEQLRNLLFEDNKTKFPNGSLLHLKPTNEVFLITHGKKILFPGPEILLAFGYSFDNMIDVEQSDIDQFPSADQKVFLWTMPHPDGTIFQSFPSHALYLVSDGKKYPIASKELLDSVWPENYAIPVSDPGSASALKCETPNAAKGISCQFDGSSLSGIGGYYLFTVNFPTNCAIDNIHPAASKISFSSEKSIATVKESLKNIVASVLNRYFYK